MAPSGLRRLRNGLAGRPFVRRIPGPGRTVELLSEGQTYGLRNVLEAFPEAAALLHRTALRDFVTTILGSNAGIVYVLLLDKPPDRSWSLPWDEDRTIAVKRNDLTSKQIRNPTIKADVPHVVAPASDSENVLALRIHLDPMVETNGPLRVIPGSHRNADDEPRQPVELHANPGDVLAVRPLLTHSSVLSRLNHSPSTRDPFRSLSEPGAARPIRMAHVCSDRQRTVNGPSTRGPS